MQNEYNSNEFDINYLPSIVEKAGDQLPQLLKEVVEMGADKVEKDSLLLGALTTLSAAMPNVWGLYGGRKVHANLFFFLSAPASTGKGKLGLCKRLVMPIHNAKKMARKNQLEQIISDLEAADKKVTPADLNIPQKMFIIPGNSTSTAIYQGLGDNDGVGLITETEADTLTKSLNGEHSFSDGLRKAFHHETISYFRRADNEFVEVTEPKLSVMLSGTPNQVFRMMPDTEDGLFSRFILYAMPRTLVWNNMFEKTPHGGSLDENFDRLGMRYFRFYNALMTKTEGIEFELRERHVERFNSQFEKMQQLLADVYGDDIVASVRRMGLIVYRMAMILSMVRLIDCLNYTDPLLPNVMKCSDKDFDTAMWMSEVLIKHTIMIFRNMPEGEEAERNFDLRTVQTKRMLEQLPMEFTRADALMAGDQMELSKSMVDKYLRFMKETDMVKQLKRGVYEKISV